MSNEMRKSELKSPGPEHKAATELFDKTFDRAMHLTMGDVTAAAGKLLDQAACDVAFGEAIIFKHLCALVAEATAAGKVLSMSDDQRQQHATGVFALRFDTCIKAAHGNIDQACGELLREAFTDAELNAAVLVSHISSFREAWSKGVFLSDTTGASGRTVN